MPRFYVRLYKDAGRGEDALVGAGVSYVPSGSVTVYRGTDPEPPSGTTMATVTLNYVQDNQEIVLTPRLYTIDMYRADPYDSETDEDDIVARAGSLTDLLSGNVVADLEFFAVNGSGLSDISLDVDDQEVSDGYLASAVVGFANGDKFTFETECTVESRFQAFLRDNFDKVFPATSSGNEEIPDHKTRNAAYIVGYQPGFAPGPDCRGEYAYAGVLGGEPLYRRIPGTNPYDADDEDVYWLWWDICASKWRISLVAGDVTFETHCWYRSDPITGEYSASGGYSGKPVVTEAD
jgi:hypothetical protein